MESIKVMASVDLSVTFPDKEIVVQKEPVPPVKEVLPKLQKEIGPCGAFWSEENRENRSSTHLRSHYWKPLKLHYVGNIYLLSTEQIGHYGWKNYKNILYVLDGKLSGQIKIILSVTGIMFLISRAKSFTFRSLKFVEIWKRTPTRTPCSSKMIRV